MVTGMKWLAVASVVGLVAGTTSADTVIDTIPDWDGNVSSGWTNIAQSFTVPEGDIVLNTFELGIRSLDGESYNLLLHAWDPIGDHAVGNALYDSGLLAAPGALTFIEFEIGVALAAGESYAIIVAWNNRGISSGVAFSFADQYDGGYNTYTDGSIFDPWKFGPDTDFEMAFRATFETPGTCPWDLDGSGDVGASDLLSLLVSWGPCKGCPADFDDSGSVGASDLLALLANWGPCP